MVHAILTKIWSFDHAILTKIWSMVHASWIGCVNTLLGSAFYSWDKVWFMDRARLTKIWFMVHATWIKVFVNEERLGDFF